MTIRPLFTVHMLRPFHAFSNVLNFIEAELSMGYIKPFSTLSGVRRVFSTVPQIDILCTRAVKRYYAHVHVSPVSWALKFMEARSSSDLSPLSFLLWELCNQNCIVKTSETLLTWSACCYTAGSDTSDAAEGVLDRLLKIAAMVLWYTVDMLNCCWPTDVHSQRWLSILREPTVCNNWTSCLN